MSLLRPSRVGKKGKETCRKNFLLSREGCIFAHSMLHLLHLLFHPAEALERFRHRRGFGIHSPFAYGLVREVIFERGMYYAYEGTGRSDADGRLLFRLANFQQPAVCFLAGEEPSGAQERWLRKGCGHSIYLYTPPQEGADLIFAAKGWEEHVDELHETLAVEGLLVVDDIRSSKARRAAWTRLRALPKAQVCFDLKAFGLVFFKPGLQRQFYLV